MKGPSRPEWLTGIPGDWTITPLGFLGHLQTGPFGSQLHADDYVDGGVPVINPSHLKDGHIEPDDGACVSDETAELLARHKLVIGDVVFARRGELGRCATVGASEAGWLCGTGSLRLRVDRSRADPRYVALAASVPGARDWLLLVSVGATMDNLNTSILGRLPVPLPPVDVQSRIVYGLDRKTVAIDALIEKKERLAALVEERRHATIWSSVTKGVDPTPSRRESGHDWLGSIPAHWDVARTRHVARLESGHTPSRQHPEYWVPEECTIPWVSLADVWQIRDGRLDRIRETAERVSPIGIANSAARLLPAETVVVSRTASVGFSAIIAEPMATTQDFVNWICGPRLRPKYLLYVFRAMRDEFRRLAMGSTHQTIYMPDVAKFVTPVPPLAEQEAIIRTVEGRLRCFDAGADALAKQIETLREYRQALITAAVTGQVDAVRGEAADARAAG